MVVYRNGNRPQARTRPFYTDTVAPYVSATSDARLFSPDGDGRRDAITIRQTSSKEDLWEAEIVDSRGKQVKSLYWKERVTDFVWDGHDDRGNKIADGLYTYSVAAEDAAGNRAAASLEGIRIDTQIAQVFVTVSNGGFSPNEDGVKDTIDFKTYVGLKEGIASWTLSLAHASEGVQKSFSGTEAIPEKFTWDGRAEGAVAGAAAFAADGDYVAVFEVEYHKGNKPQGKTRPFKLDTVAPAVKLSFAPLPFSPDNDGVDDELTIAMDVEDLSPITEWDIEVLDPKGHHFISYAGKGEPTKSIIWDGISDRGELVQAAADYTLVLSMRDEFGNVSSAIRTVPVDVLVTREGDRLKIIISSIVFAGNSAEYLGADVEEEKGERNLKTLDRLAEILKKYSRYRILIEGHAVMIHWDDAEQGQSEQLEVLIPLSKARAEAVKTALVQRGIAADRITTEGLGGQKPLVPHSDLDSRWKNRRVEFILIK